MARAISFVLATAASLGLLFLPAMRGEQLSAAAHGLLAPMLLLICGCFVHGLGYIPRARIVRRMLHPAILWVPLAGFGMLLANEIMA